MGDGEGPDAVCQGGFPTGGDSCRLPLLPRSRGGWGGCWNWATMVQGSAVLFKPSNGLTCPWYFHCLIINERKTARESPPVDHLPLNKAAHVAVSTFLALSLLLSFCNLILTQLYYYSVSLWVTFPPYWHMALFSFTANSFPVDLFKTYSFSA